MILLDGYNMKAPRPWFKGAQWLGYRISCILGFFFSYYAQYSLKHPNQSAAVAHILHHQGNFYNKHSLGGCGLTVVPIGNKSLF